MHPTAVQNIAPVQYNGKAKRQSLETVYLRYMKAGVNLTDMISAVNGGVGGEGDAQQDNPPGVRPPIVQYIIHNEQIILYFNNYYHNLKGGSHGTAAESSVSVEHQ